jgi:hypothetical protein
LEILLHIRSAVGLHKANFHRFRLGHKKTVPTQRRASLGKNVTIWKRPDEKASKTGKQGERAVQTEPALSPLSGNIC